MQRIIETPPQITPDNDNGYLEELTKAIFRAGFSWQVVRLKWDNFRLGFDGFDVDKVAAYDQPDIARLMNDSGIVRNRRKILATIENAQTVQALSAAHGSFQGYLRSLDHLDYHEGVKELTGQFRGLGRTSAFVFLHCVNEPTPGWSQR